MLKRGKENKRVFKAFLLSYLLVLAVPLVVGSISYISAASVVEEEAVNYNMAMLDQAKQSIDAQFQSIDQIINDILLNPVIQRFVYKQGIRNGSDVYEAAMVMKEIARYSSLNALIGQLYIYFGRSDVIINSSGKYPLGIFYEKVTPYESITFDQWNEMLRDYHYKDFLGTQNIADGSGRKAVVTYMRSIPLNSPKQNLGTLAVIIDEGKLKSLFADIGFVNQGAIYILDKNGRTLASTGDINSITPNYEKMKNSGSMNYYHDKINDKKMIVSYTTSKYNGWKYVSIMPTSIFMDKVNYIKTLTVWVFIMSLTLGLIMAYMMAHRNYAPIKTIVRFLSEKMGIVMPARYHNEYDFVQCALNDIMEKNHDLENIVGGQSKVLKYYFPMDLEERLIKSVKAGDRSETLRILNDVFERNVRKNNGSIDLTRCLFFDLMCTAVKIISSTDNYESDDNLAPSAYLQQCDTVDKMKEMAISIYEGISERIARANRSCHEKQVLDRIMRYIEVHCCDNELGLSTISEAVDLTPSYISHFFKMHMGMSIVDYINGIRMERAKQILAEDEGILIGELAIKVGFTTDVGFIRTFKKHEGITPGKYRDIMLNNRGNAIGLSQNCNINRSS